MCICFQNHSTVSHHWVAMRFPNRFKPHGCISQEGKAFIWPHPAQWDIRGRWGQEEYVRKTRFGFNAWRLIIYHFISHSSLTLTVIYVAFDNFRKLHIHSCLHLLNVSIPCPWQVNKDQMSVYSVRKMFTRRKTRRLAVRKRKWLFLIKLSHVWYTTKYTQTQRAVPGFRFHFQLWVEWSTISWSDLVMLPNLVLSYLKVTR